MERTRNDPFNPKPKGFPVNGTPRQLDLLDALQPPNYPILPTSYLHKLFGSYAKPLVALLNGEGYIRIPFAKECRRIDARNNETVWEITDKGLLLLSKHSRHIGIAFPNNQFPHAYLGSIIQFSFDQACREIPGLSKRSLADILAREETPQAVRADAAEGRNPSWIPLKDTYIKPDAPLFGLTYESNGKKRTLYLHGHEDDCGTEPVTGFNRQTIERKLAHYAQYLEGHTPLYKKRYGLPNCYIPIITTMPERAKNILDLIEKNHPKLAHKFLVKVTTPFQRKRADGSYEAMKPAPPTGHMVTDDWMIAGGKTFNILETLKGEANGRDAESGAHSRAA